MSANYDEAVTNWRCEPCDTVNIFLLEWHQQWIELEMSILCENGRTQRFRILRVITETWRWTMHFRASCSYLHSNHANHRYEWRWTKFWSAVNIRIHMRCSPKLERTRLQNRPEILKNPGSDFQHLCLFPSAEHRKNGYLLGRWRKTSGTLLFS